MSQHSIEERVIALAAIFQACALVQQIARHGRVDNEPFESLIKSIMITNADNTEDIYGGISGVQLGLSTIAHQVSSKKPLDMEVTRYLLSLLHLEKKLHKQPAILQKLGDGIDSAISQSEHFSTTHENVIAKLGGIYAETISTIQPKIMVDGEHGHLSNPNNANKVRALLLAGMRAAILWRQCGGNRLQLLFQRKNLILTAQSLLQNSVES